MLWQPHYIKKQLEITCYYTFFVRHFVNDYTFRGETHNFWECLCVLNGELQVTADERVYMLHEGSMIFHKPFEFHKFSVCSENGADCLVFSFDMIGTLCSSFAEKAFLLTPDQQLMLRHIIGSAVPTDEYTTLLNRDPISLQLTDLHILQLLLSVSAEPHENVPSTDMAVATFEMAVTYIRANLSQSPKIDDIATHCNTSTSSLKRCFEKYAGTGVHRYMLLSKINTAKEMLKRNMRVNEIAHILGFCDEAYFSVAFKRETGMSPSEYARNK